MTITPTVQSILRNYEGESPGVKANLVRMLMQGRLAGTGKMIILPVDQGFEHGPARSFGVNPAAYDPHYHYQLALDAGLSAYAAPLGPLEAGADTFAGRIPLILKVNSANSLLPSNQPKTHPPGGLPPSKEPSLPLIGFAVAQDAHLQPTASEFEDDATVQLCATFETTEGRGLGGI